MRRFASLSRVLALAAAAMPACGGGDAVVNEMLGPLESEVLMLVNQERAANGNLPPLVDEQRLIRAARAHNDLMASRNELTHKFDDERTLCIAGGDNDRYDAVGYPWRWCGENVARGQATAQEVVAAWMASPPHRANILSTDAKELGIAYRGAGATHWWTQAFGAR